MQGQSKAATHQVELANPAAEVSAGSDADRSAETTCGTELHQRNGKQAFSVPAQTRADHVGWDNRNAIDEGPEQQCDLLWCREFDRRSRDALAGLHHPMLHELLMRMPPLHDSIDADAQIFSERLLARLREDGVERGTVVDRLQALQFAPTRDACRAAALALDDAWRQRPTREAAFLVEASGRCDYYAAAKDGHAEAFRTAGRALLYCLEDSLPETAQVALAEAAVGWLARAGWDLPDVVARLGPERGGPALSRVPELGREALRRINCLLES